MATYRARVARRWPAEDVPVRPAAGGRDSDPARVLAIEAERIRKHLPAGWQTVALDESGERLTSAAFAGRLGELEGRGVAGVAFVVGSDLGLDRELAQDAVFRLSLSDMTLPHLVARLVFWEQLFRATAILGGGGYHRDIVQ